MSSAAFGADFTGKWSGAFNVTTPDGEVKEESALLSLKQSGTELTGTAGPNAEKQWPIKEGKVSGEVLEFKVAVDDGEVTVRLRPYGESLKGEATMTGPQGKVTAKLDLKREK